MLPIVSIVGHSQSGKTTLAEQLIVEFKRRGLRVAAIKHTCQDFDMDKPGKDTWRYAEAGSDAVVISSPTRLAVLRPQADNESIEDVLRLLGPEYDLIIIEGFHGGHAPKIEVHRKELKQGLRCNPDEVKAIVTDEKLEVDRPQFSWDEISSIADFILKQIIGKRGDETALYINGETVPLNRFTQDMFASALLGMASTLKGVGQVNSLEISVRRA